MTTQQIAIVGCGYTGLRLAREATRAGYGVVGTSRSEASLEELEAMGAEGLDWDVLDDDVSALREVLGPQTAVVYSIPTLYRDYVAGQGEQARHVAPVERVLDAAVDQGAGRFIYLSSTSVYGDHDGAWVDEETETSPTSPYGKMRRDIEEHVLGRSEAIDVNVARLVGIYGPGRTMLNYMKSGRYKLVDGGRKPSNRIHVDDIVQSVVAMVERAPDGGRLYNVSDGHPRRVAEVVDWLVEHCDIDRPEEISLEEYRRQRGENAAARWENTYRVSNDRLTDELDVELRYPDVLDGYADIFEVS
jgi:nucleoside-diphosphate-sugar epimerase